MQGTALNAIKKAQESVISTVVAEDLPELTNKLAQSAHWDATLAAQLTSLHVSIALSALFRLLEDNAKFVHKDV